MQGHDYLQLYKAFRDSVGHGIYWQIRSIGVSFNVLRGNETELIKKLQHHATTSSLRAFNQSNRDALEAEFQEMFRLIHNYVASTSSLVDHTRRIAHKLLSGDALKQYQQQVDSEFKNDELTSFLRELRNHLLHVSHPPLAKTARFDEGSPATVGVELSAADLLKSGTWNSASRSLINRFSDGIPLVMIVSQYSEKVTEFYLWLTAHLATARKPELDDLWQKQQVWVDWCRDHGISITGAEMKAFPKRTT